MLAKVQRLCLWVGVLLLVMFAAGYVYRSVSARAELTRFHEMREKQRASAVHEQFPQTELNIDFSLWSKKRIEGYEQSLTEYFDAPLAVLRIPRLGLEVPVLEGTDDLTLNRGVGHIDGTPEPGTGGNIGIAGHRDGFFRALKDITPGDVIELETPNGKDIFKVDEVVLVRPNDVSVLQPRAKPSLTLVTCYPFYFIGSAPQRFIVRASITDPDGTGLVKFAQRSRAATY